MSGLEEKGFGFEREAICRYRKKKEEGNMGFGFGREGPWVIWKRSHLRVWEKRRKKEIKKKERIYF